MVDTMCVFVSVNECTSLDRFAYGLCLNAFYLLCDTQEFRTLH